MNCKKVCEELVFLYTDNEMGSELRIAFQNHVECCPHCAREFRHVHKLVMVVRERAARCDAPVHLRERLLQALHQRRGTLSS